MCIEHLIAKAHVLPLSQIAPKWLAKDGKSFWIVFTDFRNGGKKPYYSFNCQKVRILTEEN